MEGSIICLKGRRFRLVVMVRLGLVSRYTIAAQQPGFVTSWYTQEWKWGLSEKVSRAQRVGRRVVCLPSCSFHTIDPSFDLRRRV
jgi:hypothetical protein